MTVELRFSCTACGKCCYGCLPLTLHDAVAHAGRFPLALVWTTVPFGARNYSLATKLGFTLPTRKRTAAIIMPTAYMPSTFACPELSNDGRCGIHQNKPSRCMTMPFYPYREESDQRDMLTPRKAWLCQTSLAAPVVYRNRTIVDRTNFDIERNALLEQAWVMQQYANYMFKYSPWVLDSLASMASNPAGNLVTSLSSFLTATKHLDATEIAGRQLPVLEQFAARTAENPVFADYHRSYSGWAREMDFLSSRLVPETGIEPVRPNYGSGGF